MSVDVSEQPQVHVRVRIPQPVVFQTGCFFGYFYLQLGNHEETLLYFWDVWPD